MFMSRNYQQNSQGSKMRGESPIYLKINKLLRKMVRSVQIKAQEVSKKMRMEEKTFD